MSPSKRSARISAADAETKSIEIAGGKGCEREGNYGAVDAGSIL